MSEAHSKVVPVTTYMYAIMVYHRLVELGLKVESVTHYMTYREDRTDLDVTITTTNGSTTLQWVGDSPDPTAVIRRHIEVEKIQGWESGPGILARIIYEFLSRPVKELENRPANTEPTWGQKYVLESRNPATGELLLYPKPETKHLLPKGCPSVTVVDRDTISKMYWEMSGDTSDSAFWETICNYFNSINWYWRPKTW